MVKETKAGGSMDKQYMLDMLQDRMEQLEADYRALVNQTGQSGTEVSYGSAKTMRSNNRRAYGICKLLHELVFREQENFEISDPDEIRAFDRLVEPKVISRVKSDVLDYPSDGGTASKIAAAKRKVSQVPDYPTY